MAAKTQRAPVSRRASAGAPQLPDDHPELVAQIKREIGAGRTRSALVVRADAG